MAEPNESSESSDVETEDACPTKSHNRNPTGHNQYQNCSPRDDPVVSSYLIEYHRHGITNRKAISQLLNADHGITMSEVTVARRRKQLNLYASGHTTQFLSGTTKRQLVLDQLAVDPTNRQGPKIIREAIANSTSIHLTRDYITEEMHKHEPRGFELRQSSSKKAKRSPITVLGPHHEWSGDRHDKLSAIGFPLWGVCDVWSGAWLGLWVVPNNRLKAAIAYIFLSLVEQLEGMPVQMTTDCGSETGRIFGLVNTLRETFAPHLGEDAPPAHQFLRSVNNITIERGWLQLRLQWGNNVKIYWEAREGIYHPQDLKHFELVQWLWPKLINQELNELRDCLNNHRVCKDRTKISPSGTTPHIALSLYKEYNVEWMLQHVDHNVVQDLMEELGGADLVRFISVGYAERAEVVYSGLGISKLSFHNVWEIFRAMLPLI
ncbi:hypothetical protein Clacol_004323 [Clathrus columnatus]|uniref:Integrase core domain-containing protein n=1 Tax=Clathrus columnatus TaxID=1419009 RepID=A0AAV5A660_9AGAM|nr:hypothetical protein Clacol_004323 [Clathrus columnatus]